MDESEFFGRPYKPDKTKLITITQEQWDEYQSLKQVKALPDFWKDAKEKYVYARTLTKVELEQLHYLIKAKYGVIVTSGEEMQGKAEAYDKLKSQTKKEGSKARAVEL